MNINRDTPQNSTKTLLGRLTRLWGRLTAPSPAIQEAEQQHIAQLLSALLLALNLVNITVQPFPSL